MRCVLGSLGVLLADISTGHSLSCTVCEASGTTSCTGRSVTCPSDRVCGALYTKLSSRGSVENHKIYNRGCVPQKQCDMEGHINLADNHTCHFVTSCCDTYNCVPPLPKLSARSTTLNGLVCQTCYGNFGWCSNSKNVQTMQCRGNEDVCLLRNTTYKVSSEDNVEVVNSGCATKNMCDLWPLFLESDDKTPYTQTKFICSGGISGLYGGFAFSFIVALLLNKLLS